MTTVRGHVLLVDDDADIREMLPLLLASYGYRTEVAAEGAEALAVLKAGGAPTCLVLLDLMMPGMDGYQFRAAQLADPALADLPVVVLTGADRPDAAALGAPILVKPVDLDDLLDVVRAHC